MNTLRLLSEGRKGDKARARLARAAHRVSVSEAPQALSRLERRYGAAAIAAFALAIRAFMYKDVRNDKGCSARRNEEIRLRVWRGYRFWWLRYFMVKNQRP